MTRNAKAAKRSPTSAGVKTTRGRASKAKSVLARAPVTGWRTSDADEIALRHWRGSTDLLDVAPLEPDHGFFGTFRARSVSGGTYEVEIRSLDQTANSCGCIDHRVNGLGTCKHIEGVLVAIRRGKVRAFSAAAKIGSPRVELFLDARRGSTPSILWPTGVRASDHQSPTGGGSSLGEAHDWLRPWLGDNDALVSEAKSIEALLAAWPAAPSSVTRSIRLSRHFKPWLERARRAHLRDIARAGFERDVAEGRDTLDVLTHPLLPYQKLGAIHLAFGERAMLADDMGLGKTIQAIAACEILARRKGVDRVLIVCPASLKAEWDEQIARFCGRSLRVVFGGRMQRLAAYRDPGFFTIVNYEQVLSDVDDLNAILKPGIVVLDEAQRIKNWQTKTARHVKLLRSPYAFVLTGTPIENRIDEIYSIVQYLDPELLGPLFRFNRDFYELDERGRPVDYKNLAELRERIRPVMLRRRKADVETELPGRTIKNYFVPMSDEQKVFYEDYRMPAAQLIAQAQRRPLLQKEFDRLQQLLACMRMVCDTPAILDPTCRVSPKLEELEGILDDLLAEPDRKIIIFSEWERMLAMVRELAGAMGAETAWHTGSVPQDRRRAEINRFKRDPACRLFLSTDSGSVGLNLQVASAVINVDLPWNPAKHEQRIARAWRKNQMRSVSVINLVTEGSIEHSILHLLGQKQALADGVLDGQGDLGALKMPSGRGAFIERMQAMMAHPSRETRMLTPEELAVADLVERLGDAVLLVESRLGGDGRATLLAVVDVHRVDLAIERKKTLGAVVPIELLDRDSWETMNRLSTTGLLRFMHEARTLHRSAEMPIHEIADAPDDGRAADAIAEAARALEIGIVLSAGGFPEEVAPHLVKALRGMAVALTSRRGEVIADPADDANIRRLVAIEALPEDALRVLDAANLGTKSSPPGEIQTLMATTTRILAAIKQNEPGFSSDTARPHIQGAHLL